MFCPKCGSEVQDSQAFCSSCGKKIKDNGINKKKRKKLLLFPVIAGIVLLIITVVVIVSCSKDGANKAIDDWFDAVRDCDTEKYVSVRLTDEEIKEDSDGDRNKYIDSWESIVKRLKRIYKKDGVNFNNLDYESERVRGFTNKEINEINEDYEEDKISVECTEGAIYRIKIKGAGTKYFTLRKLNDKWYVIETFDELDDVEVIELF